MKQCRVFGMLISMPHGVFGTTRQATSGSHDGSRVSHENAGWNIFSDVGPIWLQPEITVKSTLFAPGAGIIYSSADALRFATDRGC